ncbi:MAG: SDR family NAD(P)-dependent oxidoreductase [Janthinobacterium lividum]
MIMNGKVVLVAGGSGGIGAATARLFAEAGASVILTHRPGKEGAGRSVAQALPGPGHLALPLDVENTGSILALHQSVAAAGHTKLDVLVNSAGFTQPVPHADLDALTDELIDRMFAVNWRGQFATIRTFAPMLGASGDGLIVSISSIAAMNGNGSSIAYCAVKAGIDVMTKSLARALAPSVRVLAVSPGVVDTGFVPGRGEAFNARTASSTPLQRVATAKDVARAVLACATHLTFSTGQTIVVDGGRML